MMRFKDKRSKITSMQIRGQYRHVRSEQGMASIVVVSVLIIIMTLISIGFARLVNRAAINSANKQFSASATYAAESAINDVASYLKTYAQENQGITLFPKSDKCNGPGSLIGDSNTPGPFYNDSNLSKDKLRSTQYNCLLLDPTPSSLVYTQVNNLKSQVVKVNTTAQSGALDKLMISWQASDTTITGYPKTTSLYDETTWNGGSAICQDGNGNNASCIPMLRLSLFPISNGEKLDSAVQTQSKTVFLYPQKPSGNIPVKSYNDASNFKDGSLIGIPCVQTVGTGDFNPTTASDYKCNLIIKDLASAILPQNIDSVYLRLTPIYNQADIKIQANDKFGDYVDFINDQAVVDATAQTGGVVKRLQARLDTSSLANGGSSSDNNISSSADAIPEQTIRTPIALCKREQQTVPSNGFSSYINLDTPDGVCHDVLNSTPITNPVPTLAFSIVGKDGKDNGLRVCSAGDTPENNEWGCSTANNPDQPQNPVEQGTVYISSSVDLQWHTTDASACVVPPGDEVTGWAGDQTGKMSFSGNPPTIGDGKVTISSISLKTTYDLQCSRPHAPAATPVKQVTAWPPPLVSVSGPATVNAGDNYSVSWSSANSVRCSLSGNWSDTGQTGTSGSETMNWPWNDNSSTRTFTATCSDPIGRSASSTYTLSVNGSGSSSSGKVLPPVCTGTATITYNSGWSYYYQASCPVVAPYNGGYHVNSTIPELPSGDVPASQAVPGWIGYIGSRGPNYCIQIVAWVAPWGSASSPNFTSTQDCKNVFDPLKITNFQVYAWDQGPYECGWGTGEDNYWYCRNGYPVENDPHDGGANRFTVLNKNAPGCPDGDHRFTTCAPDPSNSRTGVKWSVQGGGGTVYCTASATNYGNFTTSLGSNFWGGPFRWVGSGNPEPFYLNCNDSYGNSACVEYNGADIKC